MRRIKILAIVCFVGLMLQIYAHINLKISYKYEVDLMETHVEVSKMSMKEKAKEFHLIALKKQEVARQQKVIAVFFFVFLIGLIILLYFILSKQKLSNKVNQVSVNNTDCWAFSVSLLLWTNF